MDSFDFIVVGGGSGGIAAARRAARYGAKVAVIEAKRIGGTCVNTGCVPKKIMWNAATVAEALHDAPGYGFEVSVPSFDWAGVRQRREAYIERLNGIYARNLAADGVEQIAGHARLAGAGRVEVGDRVLTAAHVLIATGGAPRVPELAGAELGGTSDDFFALESQPQRVAIVGAGYTAVELAGIFNAIGTDTTLVCRYEHTLRHFDDMLGEQLSEEMTRAGVHLVPNATVAALHREERGQIGLRLQEGELAGAFDRVFWAIGRDPTSGGLGLERAGVEVAASGHVVVDEYQNTSVAGVYAVGDVTPAPALTPVAIAAGRRLSDRLFGGQPDARLAARYVPSVVFSHPPIGSVGLGEAEANERYGADSVRVYTSRFTNIYHALTERRTATRIKLVVHGADERVVGIHVIGIAADELIQGFAVAMEMGATKADLDRTLAIHPTAAEELVTLR